jgi:hypothetical protein
MIMGTELELWKKVLSTHFTGGTNEITKSLSQQSRSFRAEKRSHGIRNTKHEVEATDSDAQRVLIELLNWRSTKSGKPEGNR